MTGRRSLDNPQAQIDTQPVRRARVEQIKHAMRDVLALAELRASRRITQQQLAEALRVSQANVSRVEHQDDLNLSTLRSYVEALGGGLQIRAVFEDETIDLDVRESETV